MVWPHRSRVVVDIEPNPQQAQVIISSCECGSRSDSKMLQQEGC